MISNPLYAEKSIDALKASLMLLKNQIESHALLLKSPNEFIEIWKNSRGKEISIHNVIMDAAIQAICRLYISKFDINRKIDKSAAYLTVSKIINNDEFEKENLTYPFDYIKIDANQTKSMTLPTNSVNSAFMFSIIFELFFNAFRHESGDDHVEIKAFVLDKKLEITITNHFLSDNQFNISRGLSHLRKLISLLEEKNASLEFDHNTDLKKFKAIFSMPKNLFGEAQL